MAKFDEVPLSGLPDAGTLAGDELVYVLQPGKVSRRSTVARIRQGLATLADLAGVSIGNGNVPPGGAAGAALIKASADSYDTMWDTTGGTGHVPDPAEEPDGRKLVTQTGGLVYVDDDPKEGLLPDPAEEPDGLVVTTEAGEYVLEERPTVPDPSQAANGQMVVTSAGGYTLANPPAAPVQSVNNKTGAITLTYTDVGADQAGAAATAETAAKAASVPLTGGLVVVDSPTPVTRPSAAIVLWLDDDTNAIAGDWRPAQ